ncbi:MAG: hypothetical protein L0K43_08250, partial [Bifidobacterium crudilactis]|nr:hypothetical protein [Bifidobacterium crudilactis]
PHPANPMTAAPAARDANTFLAITVLETLIFSPSYIARRCATCAVQAFFALDDSQWNRFQYGDIRIA